MDKQQEWFDDVELALPEARAHGKAVLLQFHSYDRSFFHIQP